MTKKLRRIPYGTMNWELIVRECHFVDNTAYIRRLENCRTPVFLRPKRFGKSMVCSMLADWGDVPLDAVVVEVCSNRGYNWIPVTA